MNCVFKNDENDENELEPLLDLRMPYGVRGVTSLGAPVHSSGNWEDIPQNVIAQCQNRIVRKLMRTEVSLPQIRYTPLLKMSSREIRTVFTLMKNIIVSPHNP